MKPVGVWIACGVVTQGAPLARRPWVLECNAVGVKTFSCGLDRSVDSIRFHAMAHSMCTATRLAMDEYLAAHGTYANGVRFQSPGFAATPRTLGLARQSNAITPTGLHNRLRSMAGPHWCWTSRFKSTSRTLECTDDQQRILSRLSAWGGVLDFGFFATCNELDSTEDDHREAIKLTFARLRSDLESYADKTSVDRGIDRSKFFSINFDEASISMLTPEKISWRQFLGTRYDFQRDGLLVHGIKSHLNSLFFYQDEELEENIAEPMDLDELSDDASDAGFAYAFSDHPIHCVRIQERTRTGCR